MAIGNYPLHQQRGNQVVGRVEERGRDVADCADDEEGGGDCGG